MITFLICVLNFLLIRLLFCCCWWWYSCYDYCCCCIIIITIAFVATAHVTVILLLFSFLLLELGSWMPTISAANTLIPSESDNDKTTSTRSSSSSSEGSCIGYYITVICNDIDNVPQGASSPSWKVVRRYSQFYDLYCKLSHRISSEFPGGRMMTPFNDDRLRVWWCGSTEDICRQRQERLDQWLREILTTPLMMANTDVYDMLSEFLEVKIHTSKKISVIPNPQVAAISRRVLPISPSRSPITASTTTSTPMHHSLHYHSNQPSQLVSMRLLVTVM